MSAWPMFQVLAGATKRYRCLGSRCYPCQPPPKKTLQVTGTSCTSTPRPQSLMELWAIFLEDSQGGRPPKPLWRECTRLEIFSDSSFRVGFGFEKPQNFHKKCRLFQDINLACFFPTQKSVQHLRKRHFFGKRTRITGRNLPTDRIQTLETQALQI